jgi:hypothetical protein
MEGYADARYAMIIWLCGAGWSVAVESSGEKGEKQGVAPELFD